MEAGKNKIRVAVVDDQRLFRKGLITLISEFNEFEIVLEAEDGKDFIDRLNAHTPQVVLLDVDMPAMDGIQATEYLHRYYPDIKILILTTYDDADLVYLLAQKGAHGFLLKDSDLETVAEAIHAVMEGNRYYRGDINEKLLSRVSEPVVEWKPGRLKEEPLSEREIEILRLICRERTTREIAEELKLAVKTVEGHRDKIYQKVGARNLVGLVKYAIRHKLIVDFK